MINDHEGGQVPTEGGSYEIPQNEAKRAQNIKVLIASLLFAFFIFLTVDTFTTQYVRHAIVIFTDWIGANPTLGVFVFMAAYTVATVLFIPGLTIASGFIFAHAFGLGPGVLLGTLTSFCGAYAGATISFFLGRYLFRDWAKGLTKKYTYFEALDICMVDKGLYIMVLLRLSPLVPFTINNYLAGVTSISLWTNAIALLWIFPGTVLYVFLGASAGTLYDSATNTYFTIAVLVVGVIMGIATIWLTSYYTKRALNEVILAKQYAVDQGVSLTEESGGDVSALQAEAV